ncbi:MAG TPA: 4-alpha-glucanotransferase [Propionibacteriaceae bacterium]|nr:4-alpha-glucanotransferase [Propionibacteriaceae bacterium]
MPDLDPALHQLAEAYSIATDFWDWQGRHVSVAPDTITGVLAALGVHASTPEQVRQALTSAQQQRWSRMLPPFLAVRQGQQSSVPVHVSHGDAVELWIELETGETRHDVHQLEHLVEPQVVEGRTVGEAMFAVPADLPMGYHTVHADSAGGQATMVLIVTPDWLGLPERMGHRAWGVATQLYSVRSHQSWGVGDLADLADLAVWAAADHGADYILINPLHAAEPVAPMEPSPYLPTTRRFANPLYLRVERIPEYAQASGHQRAEVDRLRAELLGADVLDRIDRDAAWAAKRAALEIVRAVPRTAGRELAYRAYRTRQGTGLEDYATWCALVESYGTDWTAWPPELQHPHSSETRAFADEHADEVDFHRWLQWVLDEQLGATQLAARSAGMSLGIMHDLAVGVHPRGADSWMLQDVYASGISVGAPPDPYNQNGQNWTQRPWRPDRMAEVAYAPFRELVATILRHAGGIRVDHVIGLFRLWWIPEGGAPTDGTYVRYDHEALVGILALEAHRAGAVVVGEDLGTVEPWVRDYLRERGILGTSILWFEFEFDAGGAPLRPEWWREYCLASVTTHDLPPTAAYLVGDHVRLREELGVLTRPLAEELAADEADRQAWLDNLVRRGALTEGSGVEETLQALHRYLTWTPSRLLCLALTDAVGDRRSQNQPGTVDEYPNWRVPLTGPDGERLMLEDVLVSQRAAALAAVLSEDQR